ncbi:hypothetical protein Tco_1208176, partial [Tanacetum coccineum]
MNTALMLVLSENLQEDSEEEVVSKLTELASTKWSVARWSWRLYRIWPYALKVISVFLFGNVAVRALGTCTGIKIQFFRDVHTFAAVLRCVSIAHFMKARWTVALQKPSEITSQLKNAAWKEPLE